MHGRSVTVERQSSLGTKTQLTVSGNILFPAISPDGKQLAYVDRRCNGADCTYAVVEQDVGGTEAICSRRWAVRRGFSRRERSRSMPVAIRS